MLHANDQRTHGGSQLGCTAGTHSHTAARQARTRWAQGALRHARHRALNRGLVVARHHDVRAMARHLRQGTAHAPL
jgi:hypothetical protein